ncbi:uncharacterized protein EV422DRAFT_520258 [Fimicolochytrium jonesii]|uniref:uncharacterized protein n=1 Tax=Fimicolochytrium jonesii TaxID=1396493 RepID=UPI0022FDCD8F|nr:uncharacterized protein EV422DRAFT_520258 [Fimicolochytrium jonesii]KAI8824482.1 hypothetical protein EV422DRAFT_520258 [Fimicolochytrium jonesii]
MAKKGDSKKAPREVSTQPLTTDPRFAKVHSDPRFIKAKRDANKVKIDSRFIGMLQSEEFGTGSSGPAIDRYGRRAKKGTKKELERFYKLDDEEERKEESGSGSGSESGSGDEVEDEAEGGVSADVVVSDEVDSEEEDEEDEEDETGGRIAGYDLARGGAMLESDSESEDEDEDAVEDDTEERDVLDIGPYGEETVPTGDETSRIAIVNMDWDHVKAKDLFKIFDGFKPASGTVKSVKIYPSEFGKERLEKEAREGPPADIFEPVGGDDLSKPLIQADDGTEQYDNVKLRKYQLERLRYYYAVLECDSVETARSIYKTCDGTEYEKSANFFDLRYVPEGMEFDDSPADEAYEPPSVYQPKDFVTQALQHSKVKLTWDEEDDDRVRVTRRKFTKDDLQDMDFKAYLASSSEDEDGEDADAIRQKFKALLGGGEGAGDVFGSKDKGEEMEITFTPGLSEKAAALLDKKKGKDASKDETVFDAYLRKRKEKRKAKKAANKAGAEEGPNSEDALVSSGDEGVDMDDPFFRDAFDDNYAPKGSIAKPEKESKPSKTKKAKNKPPTAEELKAKAELELLMADPTSTENRHFDAKQVVKEEKQSRRKKNRNKKDANKEKREGGVQDGFEINTADPRFTDLLENHAFAVDPTNPHFKKTQAMGKLLDERRKRSAAAHPDQEVPKSTAASSKPATSDVNISQLVDSVKRKSAMATNSGRGKRAKRS